jgi:mannose/fructose/N-acetylgalactosamine-specific phosphotransferase system component IIC
MKMREKLLGRWLNVKGRKKKARNKPLWLRMGILFLALAIILCVIMIITLNDDPRSKFVTTLSSPITYIGGYAADYITYLLFCKVEAKPGENCYECTEKGNFAALSSAILLVLVFWFVIGSLIGFLVEEVNKRRKK